MSKTVLLVEDDRVLNDVISRSLRTAGYDVLTAEDGEEGLKQVSKADLVLLNMKLPKVSGEEFLKRVRADGNYVPVIVITGLEKPDMMDRIGKYEIVDFVPKPFSAGELHSKVEKAVGVVEHFECLEKATSKLGNFIERQQKR